MAPGGFKHDADASSSRTIGEWRLGDNIAHNRNPHSYCGWLGALYNTIHCHASLNWAGPRFTQAEGSGPRQTVPFLGPCSLAVPCLRRPHELGTGQKTGDAKSPAPAISSTRGVLEYGLSQLNASHYNVSQLLGFHNLTELTATSRRAGTVPLATDDISVTNMVEELIRNLTVISSN